MMCRPTLGEKIRMLRMAIGAVQAEGNDHEDQMTEVVNALDEVVDALEIINDAFRPLA